MTNFQKNLATVLALVVSAVSIFTSLQVVELVRLHTSAGNYLTYGQAFGLTFAFGVLFFVTGAGFGWAAIMKRFDLI